MWRTFRTVERTFNSVWCAFNSVERRCRKGILGDAFGVFAVGGVHKRMRREDIRHFPVGYTNSLYNRRLHQILRGLVKNSGNKNGVITGTAERGVQRFSLYKRSVIAMQRYENFCINKCFSKEKLTQFFKFSRDVTRRFHFAFSRRPEKQHIWRFFLLL